MAVLCSYIRRFAQSKFNGDNCPDLPIYGQLLYQIQQLFLRRIEHQRPCESEPDESICRSKNDCERRQHYTARDAIDV